MLNEMTRQALLGFVGKRHTSPKRERGQRVPRSRFGLVNAADMRFPTNPSSALVMAAGFGLPARVPRLKAERRTSGLRRCCAYTSERRVCR